MLVGSFCKVGWRGRTSICLLFTLLKSFWSFSGNETPLCGPNEALQVMRNKTAFDELMGDFNKMVQGLKISIKSFPWILEIGVPRHSA
jgi:hypothetical protein